jgi:dipeptidyl aminopeptidase/acylaminoacyl peptidase
MLQNRHFAGILFAIWVLPTFAGPIPENLVVEGIPPIPDELRERVGPYLEFRAAAFQSWHPREKEMLVTTRFAETMQLHHLTHPGGARRQLTFFPEPVRGAAFHPGTGNFAVILQDAGGGEFFQYYRLDLEDGGVTLLTDGKSRNSGGLWARSGDKFAYSSTRRNGRDHDLYTVDPRNPDTDRMLLDVRGMWVAQDWSQDETRLLALEYISINQSYVHLVDVQEGESRLLTPQSAEPVSYANARFGSEGAVYLITDKDSEFRRLARMNSNGEMAPLSSNIQWDVTAFEISPDGQLIAFVTNEDGASFLRFLETKTGRQLKGPDLPFGIISGLEWHPRGRYLGFNLTSARSPSDAYSFDVETGRLERWTESETGGLNPERFVEPELIRMPSFDGLEISAFVYRPDPERFPGKRPVLISIHGGPESQSRPGFLGRNNFYLNELGMAVVYPNVRGSSGYGKTFLTLDNGYKREDSVKDIGTIIEWVRKDPRMDSSGVAVIGGSYGGYMVLASLIHFGERLRAGVNVVGISNFVTFLQNTQDYRRDLRRVEYGDERDPGMRDFLERISPTTNAHRIEKPLFVVQGANDPRVPLSEAEQMVRAIRENNGTVWYLMAKDEGHGFARKSNADFQFLSTILFFEEHLLGEANR